MVTTAVRDASAQNMVLAMLLLVTAAAGRVFKANTAKKNAALDTMATFVLRDVNAKMEHFVIHKQVLATVPWGGQELYATSHAHGTYGK